MKKKIGLLFIILGIAAIISSGILLTHNKLEDKRAGETADKILAEVQDEIKNSELDYLMKEEMTVKKIDGHNYIGYISIPKINRKLPVRADWDFDSLREAPQRYYGSVNTDDLVLASHSYVYHFGPISKLEPNDDVFFTDMDGNLYKYKVSNVEILRATDVDKMIDGKSDLTLFTCDYSGTKRVTVRCDRVK